jgi:hypothetical protein
VSWYSIGPYGVLATRIGNLSRCRREGNRQRPESRTLVAASDLTAAVKQLRIAAHAAASIDMPP